MNAVVLPHVHRMPFASTRSEAIPVHAKLGILGKASPAVLTLMNAIPGQRTHVVPMALVPIV